MKHYVAGFMFDPTKEKILLIEKQKPDWQLGKLNAVGGKIEHNESPVGAMVREFKEETGIITQETDWTEFCVLTNIKQDGHVYFFKSIGNIYDAKKMEDEQPVVCNVCCLHNYNVMYNLHWLIALALTQTTVVAKE